MFLGFKLITFFQNRTCHIILRYYKNFNCPEIPLMFSIGLSILLGGDKDNSNNAVNGYLTTHTK